MLRFAGQPKVLLKSNRLVLLRLALLQSSSSAAYLVFRFAKYPLSHGLTNIHRTEDGGAPPYLHTPLRAFAADDLSFPIENIDDIVILEDFT